MSIWVVVQLMLGTTTLAAVVLGFFVTVSFNQSARKWFTCMPMGALGKKARKAHAILDTQGFGSIDDWIKTLSRSPKSTLTKQINKSFVKHEITTASFSAYENPFLGWEHFKILLDHQIRSTKSWKPHALVLLGSGLEFLVTRTMVGSIDEFRIKGELVAWSCAIAKGDTYRAMWFYEKSAVSKYYIWHYTMRLGINRVFACPALRWVDLGPSRSEAISAHKQKFGFKDTKEWKTLCNYAGDFRSLGTKIDDH